jgi:hypothetical protein
LPCRRDFLNALDGVWDVVLLECKCGIARVKSRLLIKPTKPTLYVVDRRARGADLRKPLQTRLLECVTNCVRSSGRRRGISYRLQLNLASLQPTPSRMRIPSNLSGILPPGPGSRVESSRPSPPISAANTIHKGSISFLRGFLHVATLVDYIFPPRMRVCSRRICHVRICIVAIALHGFTGLRRVTGAA